MRLFFLIFTVAIFTFSCGGNKTTKENESDSIGNEVAIESADETKITEAKNCDEFIDQYEKWMDDYLELIEKYMKDPMDATLMQDYMKVAEEGTAWMTQWNTKLMACSSKEKYQKRFDKISERAEKKLEELGIE